MGRVLSHTRHHSTVGRVFSCWGLRYVVSLYCCVVEQFCLALLVLVISHMDSLQFILLKIQCFGDGFELDSWWGLQSSQTRCVAARLTEAVSNSYLNPVLFQLVSRWGRFSFTPPLSSSFLPTRSSSLCGCVCSDSTPPSVSAWKKERCIIDLIFHNELPQSIINI